MIFILQPCYKSITLCYELLLWFFAGYRKRLYIYNRGDGERLNRTVSFYHIKLNLIGVYEKTHRN